jgi:hypothetical protein
LLLNYHYLKLDLDALKDIGLELYESRNNIIINTGIDNLNQLINDQEKFISFLMDILRTNHCGSLNVVISISDLINLDNGESEFYIKFHACMQLINTNLNHKININLIVDELSIFEGFYELFDISKQEKAEMFGLSFITSADDIRAMLSSYSIQFNNLIFRLENMIVQINYKNTADYRRAYMFIYQFSQLRASIARFLECTSLPKKRSFIHQTKKRLITISFINSMKNVQTNAISPAGKFENYFSMVESL